MPSRPLNGASETRPMRPVSLLLALAIITPISLTLSAQSVPIAIVPSAGVKLTGSMEIPDGKAAIETNGSITGGEHAAIVTLPHRGLLKICPSTRVNLSTDSSIASMVTPSIPAINSDASTPTGAASDGGPGLLMALDHGAFEAYFATRKNSDVVLTPDFRIVISGPGLAAVQLRLGDKGDLCVGNGGDDAPYVTVSSIFNGGIYRVKANQRVTFQHGSLNEVVDREKESCGCPVEIVPSAAGNDFPIAQSAGLAPLPPVPPNALDKGVVSAQATVQLGYDGSNPNAAQGTVANPPLASPPPNTLKPTKSADKPGFFHSIGRFFRRIFGG